MSYFDFKLNSIRILNNREFGKAELKMFSLVTDTNIQFDFLNQLTNSITDTKKTDLIKLAVAQTLSYKQFIEIDNIKDKQRIIFGPSGYSLFRSRLIPESFDWNFMIMENDEGIRNFGKQLSSLMDGAEFDKLSKNIILLASTTVNPVALASAEIIKICGRAVSSLMKLNNDDQLCVFSQSFDIYRDYPNLNCKYLDVEDLSSNCLLDFSIFGVK